MPKHVLIGGGMVAGYAAKQFVESGGKPGDLTILSRASVYPYERPPLSKGFLLGKDDEQSILINPPEWYREHGIDLRFKVEVDSIDVENRTVESAGEKISYEKLLIATGAGVKTLKIPGGSLPGVYYLRSLTNSKDIRDAAEAGKRAVVIGAGFIGMETSAVMKQRGLDTTLILRDSRMWPGFFTDEMSAFFESYYQQQSVRLIKNTRVREIAGDERAEAVVLESGERIGCDLVIAGVGVNPCTGVTAGSSLGVDNGILVNEYLETEADGVLAAGDVANYQDVLFNKRRRVEHWDNAVSQGQHAMKVMLGDRQPFRHVPYFFSDIFDLSYEYWGDAEGADQVINRGDVKTKSFSTWWLKQKKLVAAFVMGRPDAERESAPQWIETRKTIDADRLRDSAAPLPEVIQN